MKDEVSISIDKKELIEALSKMYGRHISEADYTACKLHGGTLGDVCLLTGSAKDVGGNVLDYKLVLKRQKKWQRYFDEHSWRREYDLNEGGITRLFTDAFCMPECYLSVIEEDEVRLWMAYVEGLTGSELTPDMYEAAAYELGRFQGKHFEGGHELLQEMTNLSIPDYQKKIYHHYRSWPEVYDYVREEASELPRHLCQMIIEMDDQSADWWQRIENLPKVFCHRDYWITNIFYHEGKVKVIDWDTTGWGYLGEDMASLVADEPNLNYMVECYHRCITAYHKGFSDYVDGIDIEDLCVYEMILLMYRYRLVEWYKFAENDKDKEVHKKTLELIYEIGQSSLAKS